MIPYVTKNPSLKTHLETEKRFKPPTSTYSVRCFLGCPDNPKMGKMMMQMAMLPLGPWQFCSWKFSQKSRPPVSDQGGLTMIHLDLKKPFSNRFGWRHALNTEIPHLVEVDILLTIPKKNLRLFFERPRHDLVTKRDPPQNTTPASLLESKKQLYSSIIHHFREYPTVPPSPSVPSVFLPDARKICVHT